MSKKPKRNGTPRRHQFRCTQRLASAKAWLPGYEGQKVIQAYRKHYGVDWPTAFTELEMLGVKIDPAYKDQVLRTVQQQIEHKRQKRLEQAQPNANDFGWDQDTNFAVI